MKNSLFSNNLLTFFVDPERSNPEVLPKTEKEDQSMVIPEVPDYDTIRKEAIDSADEKIKTGQVLSDSQKRDIGFKAVLEASKADSQRREIAKDYPGSKVFTAKETMPLKEFLNFYPLVRKVFNVPDTTAIDQLFPGSNKMTIKAGDHLVIEKGGSKIHLIHVSNDELGYGSDSVQVLASLDSSEKSPDKGVAGEEDFRIVDNKVVFKDRQTELKTRLGSMYSQEALIVNDQLVVRANGQYHKIIKNKNGELSLNKERVIVKNGTKIDTNVPQDRSAVIEEALKGKSI